MPAPASALAPVVVEAKDIKVWGDLGLTGDMATKPISIYGRNSASGTYGYFKEHALFKGDYKDSVKEQPGSSSVVQSVGSDRYAIGYSEGLSFVTHSEILAWLRDQFPQLRADTTGGGYGLGCGEPDQERPG